MKRISVALAILSLCALSAAGEVALAAAEPPPVTKVVLYKHGMGYLEREGKINGNATLSLAFRTEQMKDLLTSFFAVDLGGGRISSVRYETRDPLSKQLQDILIKVPEEAALSQFLMQLKGARLIAKAAGETVDGRILGVEPITEVVNNQPIKKSYRLVLLTEAGQIRSLDLFAISEFSLADEALQRDLRRLLDLSLDSKYTNRKKLTVSAAGQGERGVRIGYLIEMPIWKCSYRIIFDEKKKDAPPLLQGWALAENNTEDDWKDVTISFVAGNPMSYVMDLYSPYYVKRVQVPIPGLQNLAVDWGAVSRPDLSEELPSPRAALKKRKEFYMGAPPMAQTMDQAVPSAPPPPMAGARGVAKEEARPLGELLAGSYESGAQGTKVGELFSYEPKEKVSIPRGQAAMVPIVSKPITGRRLLYYKASFSPKATNAFVAQNATDLTLEAGAVTFFEGSTSLGEGILGHTLPPGSQEVIPYAVDASVDVTPREKTHREPHFKARLVDGILTLTSVETLTNTWKIVNRGRDSATLWLHQPRSAGFRLSKPEKPLKEVDNNYRFELPLKPGETVDFVVEEKRDVQEKVHLDKTSEDQVRFYMAQPYLSAGAKAFMKELSDLMAQKAGLQRQIAEWTEQVKRLSEEQGRLRSNLQTLHSNVPKEQELRAKWVAALAANEDQLADRRAKLDDAGGKLRQLEESLGKKLRDYKDV
ncbi:MAG: DUF4139 domain-containing protein [Desulfomonile tiedjei]|uniref:DUF4139 domain-containing protein n=1 Tax=Desulfomonile tiedjei TaxID=2358 RepID=A0A9D6V9I3_9BACT|nr:DUF4139 domain-containing protein [Desulfomonile tiedjei]